MRHLKLREGVLVGAVGLFWCAAGLSPALAAAATSATISPQLRPSTPNTRTTVVFSARFSAAGSPLPAPLRTARVLLPEGLTNERLSWPTTRGCGMKVLLRRGANGCPPHSQVGVGEALLGVENQGMIVKAPAKLWVFVGPTNGAYVLEVLGETQAPVRKRFVFTEKLSAVSSPYSSGLETNFPALVLGPGMPPASVLEYTLTVGEPAHAGAQSAVRHRLPKNIRHKARLKGKKGHHRKQRHPRGGAVRGELMMFTPPHCPAGGYHWLAEFTFADGSTAAIPTTTPCP